MTMIPCSLNPCHPASTLYCLTGRPPDKMAVILLAEFFVHVPRTMTMVFPLIVRILEGGASVAEV